MIDHAAVYPPFATASIPKKLGDLSKLETLQLAHNKLTGEGQIEVLVSTLWDVSSAWVDQDLPRFL